MFSKSGDPWLMQFEESKVAADEIMELIHERSQVLREGSADAARLTGVIRRKMNGLKSKCDQLQKGLKDPRISEQEAERRCDMLARLKTRSDQMTSLLARPEQRNAMLEGPRVQEVRETDQTAEMDNQGLLDLQRNIMDDQDAQLEDLSRVVSSTKHISMAIGEELDLQNRLLDDLEDDVDVTDGRLRNATKSIKQLMKKNSTCGFMVAIGLLIAGLVLVLVIVLKL
mmetsp:Transcript_579/g.688  ORF Transcript_579/g.688 Transcript_579/m.688 type:complete len:227 (-) Transcript_579:1341-2021(-)